MSESTAFDTSQKDFIVRPEERVVVFAAEWHGDIVEMLVNDAVNVSMYFYGPLNSTLAEPRDRRSYSAICFGCVVQGDTPHFTFISDAVAHAIEQTACSGVPFPVMFGVLTANTRQQALDRADGTHSRKGQEVAIALLKMLDFRNRHCF